MMNINLYSILDIMFSWACHLCDSVTTNILIGSSDSIEMALCTCTLCNVIPSTTFNKSFT